MGQEGGAAGKIFYGIAADGFGGALVPERAHGHGDAGDDAVDDGAAQEFVAEFFGEALEELEGFFFGVVTADDGFGKFRAFFADGLGGGTAEGEIHDGQKVIGIFRVERSAMEGGEARDELQLNARGEENFGADGGGGYRDVGGNADDGFSRSEESDQFVGGYGSAGDGSGERGFSGSGCDEELSDFGAGAARKFKGERFCGGLDGEIAKSSFHEVEEPLAVAEAGEAAEIFDFGGDFFELVANRVAWCGFTHGAPIHGDPFYHTPLATTFLREHVKGTCVPGYETLIRGKLGWVHKCLSTTKLL